MTMNADSLDRIEREREFHNETFDSDTRASASKFYSVVRSSRAFYESLLHQNGANRRVLEYGCGPGSYAFFLARDGAEVTGIDISDVAIRQARERADKEGLKSARFERMNAEELTFPDGQFDLVCGRSIVHHLDLAKALPEVTRVLKPNGLAIFL